MARMIEQEIWLDEFGETYRPAQAVLDLLMIERVQDESWHNDVAPHFTFERRDGLMVELWFDAIKPEDRETGPKWYRYAVYQFEKEEPYTPNYDENDLRIATEDAAEAVAKFLELIDDRNLNEIEEV
jgi:hypothetical protein